MNANWTAGKLRRTRRMAANCFTDALDFTLVAEHQASPQQTGNF